MTAQQLHGFRGYASVETTIDDGTVKLTRTSPFTEVAHTRTLATTKAKLEEYGRGGVAVQQLFGDLSADEREFIMTGITPAEWEDQFGGES